jgi:hypothetical protein
MNATPLLPDEEERMPLADLSSVEYAVSAPHPNVLYFLAGFTVGALVIVIFLVSILVP